VTLERRQVERLLARVDESERMGQLELTLPKVRALCEGWLAQQDALEAAETWRKDVWQRADAAEARVAAQEQGRRELTGRLFRERERSDALAARVAAQQRAIDELEQALVGVTQDLEAALEDGMLPRSDYIEARLARCQEALLSINEEQK